MKVEEKEGVREVERIVDSGCARRRTRLVRREVEEEEEEEKVQEDAEKVHEFAAGFTGCDSDGSRNAAVRNGCLRRCRSPCCHQHVGR